MLFADAVAIASVVYSVWLLIDGLAPSYTRCIARLQRFNGVSLVLGPVMRELRDLPGNGEVTASSATKVDFDALCNQPVVRRWLMGIGCFKLVVVFVSIFMAPDVPYLGVLSAVSSLWIPPFGSVISVLELVEAVRFPTTMLMVFTSILLLTEFCLCGVALSASTVTSRLIELVPRDEARAIVLRARQLLSLSESVLGRNVTDKTKKKKLILLFFTGSFAPPHREHIDPVREAQEQVEKALGFPVLASVVFPSHDGYLAWKFGLGRKPKYATGVHRVALLKALIADSRKGTGAENDAPIIPLLWEANPPDWLRVLDLISTLFWRPGPFLARLLLRGTRAIASMLRSEIEQDFDIIPAFVCGDDVDAAVDVFPFRKVVLERPDSSKNSKASSKGSQNRTVVRVVRRAAALGYSSTKLRNLLQSERFDDAEEMSSKSVVKYLKDNALL